jgi:hypothetical protein
MISHKEWARINEILSAVTFPQMHTLGICVEQGGTVSHVQHLSSTTNDANKVREDACALSHGSKVRSDTANQKFRMGIEYLRVTVEVESRYIRNITPEFTDQLQTMQTTCGRMLVR